jgi:membrane protein DedA with SNARE-associated domain
LLSLPEVNDYITIIRIAHYPTEVYFFPLFPAIGSVIGCLLLYTITRRGEQFVVRRFHPAHLKKAEMIYRRWGLWAIVIPALLPPPMPFKVFVAAAGALEYPAKRFALAVLGARTARYYIWGIAAYFMRVRVLRVLKHLEENFFLVLGASIGVVVLFFKRRPLKHKAEFPFTD